MLKNLRNKSAGFTLIEILVVIGIIAILAAVVLLAILVTIGLIFIFSRMMRKDDEGNGKAETEPYY